ncbi:hypothetical protein, partial [Rhizobium johnstonii]|uniref:hypothetical protein n=1 Tax=Rhizobium johnstonii TaxID=3019933 RepID=UPI003F9AD256
MAAAVRTRRIPTLKSEEQEVFSASLLIGSCRSAGNSEAGHNRRQLKKRRKGAKRLHALPRIKKAAEAAI